jgi:hypothetical protein
VFHGVGKAMRQITLAHDDCLQPLAALNLLVSLPSVAKEVRLEEEEVSKVLYGSHDDGVESLRNAHWSWWSLLLTLFLS